MITSATDLLLASIMTAQLKLNYYVLGDDTDFCFPISVSWGATVMEIGWEIQNHYSEYMGVKLVSSRLFKVDHPRGEMVNIAAPPTKCMEFVEEVGKYWLSHVTDPDLVHILVIAGREWYFILRAIHPNRHLHSHRPLSTGHLASP
jgi:hypothetical protein